MQHKLPNRALGSSEECHGLRASTVSSNKIVTEYSTNIFKIKMQQLVS